MAPMTQAPGISPHFDPVSGSQVDPERSPPLIGGQSGRVQGASIAMGYVETEFAADGTELAVMVRGAPRPVQVVPMPFVPHRYKRSV